MEKYLSFNVLIIAALLFIFILPVLFVTNFTYLAADDFCRAGVPMNDYLSNFKIWYNNISGRYFNYLITYLPIYNLSVYRLILCGFIIGLGGAIYFFISRASYFFNLNANILQRILLSSLIFITTQLPSLYEYFYWYASSSVYLLSSILFLIMLGCLLQVATLNIYHTIFIAVIIVMLNGNNEMFLLLNGLILLILLLKCYYINHKLNVALIMLNLVNILSSAFVILAPASAYRESFYPNSGDILFSIMNSLLSAGMFLLKKLVDLPTLLFGIIIFLIVFSQEIKSNRQVRALHPLFALMLTLLFLAVVMVVPYYATGNLNVNQGRIGNLIQFLFIVFLVLNIYNLNHFLADRRLIIKPKFRSITLGVGIIMLVLYSAFWNANYQKLFSDLIGDDLQTYRTAIDNRLENFRTVKDGNIHLERIEAPGSLKHWEVSVERENWSYKCYKDYLYRNYEIKLDKLIIQTSESSK